jgi:vitamin B12 transporter
MTTAPEEHLRIASRCIAVVVAAFAHWPGAAQRAAPEEIVVTSSIIATEVRHLGAALDVLPGEEIELRGYSNLADALRTQPGIAVSNLGGAGKNTVVRVRGEEHFRTLLMIDGIKALDASAPQAAPSFDQLLATGDIERVEILRGPQGFIYGADAGGVVNVLTPRGEGTAGGRLGAEHGGYDTAKYEGRLSGGNERGDYFISATDFTTDGFNSQPSDASGERDGAENTTLHAKLGWNVSDALRLQLVARDIDAEAAYDSCFAPVTFAPSNACDVATRQATYKASADYTHERLTHSFGYSSATIERDNFTAAARTFGARGDIERLEYTGSFESSPAATFVYGADLQQEDLWADDARRARDQNALYAEYQGRFAERLFVSVGARYDDNDDFGSHTSARASAAYVFELDANRSLKYRASAGTGFRAPSLFEVAYNASPFAFASAAGTGLREETSSGYDVGVELDTPRLHVEVTYFDQHIEDEIVFDLAGFSGYLQTAGTSTSRGVELAAEIPVGERWRLVGNWTHNDADDAEGAQRLRRPQDFGSVGVSYRAASERLRVIANYRLARGSVDIGRDPLEDYEVLDVAASFRINEVLEIFGRLENATDERYQEVRGYNTASRGVYAGARVGF